MKRIRKPNGIIGATQVCAAHVRLACSQVLADANGHRTAPLMKCPG